MENKLAHLSQFQQLLADYHVSDKNKQLLTKTQMVLLLGASGTGRNTLIEELVSQNDFYFIVSDTTRKPRKNNGVMEQNGVEYWFVTEQDMLRSLQKGDMLEAEVLHGQQVSGISMRELQKAYEQHKTAITDIDIGGAKVIAKAHPHAKVVILAPPHFDEWLRRLKKRGDMHTKELRRRLQTALRIYQYALDNPALCIVVNETVDEAADAVRQITRGTRSAQNSDGRHTIQHLLDETELWLQNH